VKVVGAIVALAVIPLVVMAVHGSSPWLAKKLVRRAARRLPEPYGERYQEEWLAELAAMPDGGLTTLVFALCIRLRIGSMQRRLSVPSMPPADSTAEQLRRKRLTPIREAQARNPAQVRELLAAYNDFTREAREAKTPERRRVVVGRKMVWRFRER
jgi:hypothetical protein